MARIIKINAALWSIRTRSYQIHMSIIIIATSSSAIGMVRKIRIMRTERIYLVTPKEFPVRIIFDNKRCNVRAIILNRYIMSTIPIYANRKLGRHIKVDIFSRHHKIAGQVEVSFLINRKTRQIRCIWIHRVSYRKSNTVRMIYQLFRKKQFPIWGEFVHHYICETNA